MVSSSSLVLLRARLLLFDFNEVPHMFCSSPGRPGPGLIALDFATKEEGVQGLEEFEWVWDNEKLKPGLVLALEATELLGLMTWAGWIDFLNPGLMVIPRKAGLVGEITSPGRRAGLDSLLSSQRAGLETEFFPPTIRKWFTCGTGFIHSVK